MLRLDAIKNHTKNFNLSKLSRELKIPLWKIRYTLKGKNPQYLVVEKLSDYLEGLNNDEKSNN